MLVFPLSCSQTKVTPQPCFHSVSYSIILAYTIEEKTLQYDEICMLVWGLLAIMWLGGKSRHIPKVSLMEQVETFHQLHPAANVLLKLLNAVCDFL